MNTNTNTRTLTATDAPILDGLDLIEFLGRAWELCRTGGARPLKYDQIATERRIYGGLVPAWGPEGQEALVYEQYRTSLRTLIWAEDAQTLKVEMFGLQGTLPADVPMLGQVIATLRGWLDVEYTEAEIQTMFDRLLEQGSPLAYDSEWENGTGYFDGAVDEYFEPGVYTSRTEAGRDIVIVARKNEHSNIVLFRRYTNSDMLVGHVPQCIAQPGSLSTRFTSAALHNCRNAIGSLMAKHIEG